jgi:hypothetical protein
MKKCSRCGLEKSKKDFRKNKARRDGMSTYCSPCDREYQKLRYHNPEVYKQRKMNRKIYLQNRKASSRKWYLKSMYNITPEEYNKMLKKNNMGCHICGEKKNYWLHVDHDHNCCSGEKSCGRCVRGLLCHACNVILGHAKDNNDILKGAIKYLNKKKSIK